MVIELDSEMLTPEVIGNYTNQKFKGKLIFISYRFRHCNKINLLDLFNAAVYILYRLSSGQPVLAPLMDDPWPGRIHFDLDRVQIW